MTPRRCIGALLAGGAARRFGGTPKGLALVDGERIADRALAALAASTDEQIVIANDPHAAKWFPNRLIVPDEVRGLGPLSGLCSALRAAKSDAAGILVVAWDMPFVTSELLCALRETGEAGASAVVPVAVDGGPASPLCAYYATESLATCERLLEHGERRAASLAESLASARVLAGAALAKLGDPARLLRSIDTPDDLAAVGGTLP